MSSVKSALGRIWTFYSYKGGTGRSMLLANLAWLLANHGKRVLVIDWDLEAPGLHRYYRPFLDDPELTDTPGLIDHFTEFIEFARIRASQLALPSEEDNARPWHEPWLRLERNAVALDHHFESGGVVEFIGAGRQNASYAARVSEFNWKEFYDKAGGGILLEAIKQHLRLEYDYILIDSRTGLSDTAGICTVQMPDELMVCFTLNRQSIVGAAAVANSAARQRRKPTGEPGLRIWPIACRVELAEKARLDRARIMARDSFANQIWHLTRQEREVYWSRAEVLYFPYYAYEEILATIADRPGQRHTLLECVDVVLREVSRRLFKPLAPSGDPNSENERRKLIARFEDDKPVSMALTSERTKRPVICACYVKRRLQKYSEEIVEFMASELPEANVYSFALPASQESPITLSDCMKPAAGVVIIIGRTANTSQIRTTSRMLLPVIKMAIELKKRIFLICSDPGSKRLATIWSLQIMVSNGVFGGKFELNGPNDESLREEFIAKLRQRMPEVVGGIHESESDIPTNAEDPQKGQWGGKPESGGRRLTAEVKALSETWYRIVLTAESTNGSPLEKAVTFYLHPTFGSSENVIVEPIDGKATLEIHAWGAFTVGAETDDGKTRLELDLAELESAPKSFRER